MNGINAQPASNNKCSVGPKSAPIMRTTYVNRGDLPYDYEDLAATEEELQAKFSATGEHEFYTIGQWRALGTETLTNGYWDWVMSCIKKDDAAY